MARPKKDKPNRADGRFEIKITLGKDIEGKPIRKSFYSDKSKDDAKAQAEEYKLNNRVANITGKGYLNHNITFEEWANTWLDKYKKGSVKRSTYVSTYERPTRISLIPYFGKAHLAVIKPADIQKFILEQSKIYSESQIDKRLLCLNGIFETAIENDICYKNPAKNVKAKSQVERRDLRTYTQNEVDYILEFSSAHKYGLYIRILLELGLRCSELLGLKWTDFDLNNKTVTIERATTTVDSRACTDVPKSQTSIRTLPISTEMYNAVVAHQPFTDEFIVSSTKTIGNPLTPTAFSKNRYATFFSDLQAEYPRIEKLRPHELRHTCGTLLYNKTKNIFAVSKYLGHADINITTKLYVHEDIEVMRQHLGIN
jgi:Site-specific recombinase XerD